VTTVIRGGLADAAGGMDNPLLRDLGIEAVGMAEGTACFEIDLLARHLNHQGSLHGGVIATMLDAACGYAGLAAPGGQAVGAAVTMTLTISYLAKVRAGRLRATGRVTRSGRSVYFACGELSTVSGELIATAQGAFKHHRAALEA
jgi:uncharacterized protein (TIGR00369 family)